MRSDVTLRLGFPSVNLPVTGQQYGYSIGTPTLSIQNNPVTTLGQLLATKGMRFGVSVNATEEANQGASYARNYTESAGGIVTSENAYNHYITGATGTNVTINIPNSGYTGQFTEAKNHGSVFKFYTVAGTGIPQATSGNWANGHITNAATAQAAMESLVGQTTSYWVSNFGGMYCYNVMNEAYKFGTWQPNLFQQYLGNIQYLLLLLQLHHQGDPKALLQLNFNNLETDSGDMAQVITICQQLQSMANCPPFGVGLESHLGGTDWWTGTGTSITQKAGQLTGHINTLNTMGIWYDISENDVSDYTYNTSPYLPIAQSQPLRDQINANITQLYSETVFAANARPKNWIVWQLTDKNTWEVPSNGFPLRGDGDPVRPCFLDANYNTKVPYTTFFNTVNAL